MYNRYIGNTGKFIRVEDHPGGRQTAAGAARIHPSQGPPNPPSVHPAVTEPAPPRAELPRLETPRPEGKNKSLRGGVGSGLSGLLGGFGKGGNGSLLGGLGSGLKGLGGMFDHLPFGLDIGDILLFLMLLFFFLESGDEEFIIILAVIAFSLFKER